MLGSKSLDTVQLCVLLEQLFPAPKWKQSRKCLTYIGTSATENCDCKSFTYLLGRTGVELKKFTDVQLGLFEETSTKMCLASEPLCRNCCLGKGNMVLPFWRILALLSQNNSLRLAAQAFLIVQGDVSCFLLEARLLVDLSTYSTSFRRHQF